MSALSDRPPARVRYFRFFALLLAATQAHLLLRDLVSWPRMAGIYLLLTLIGVRLGRTRLRPWVLVPAAFVLPLALRAAAFAIFRLAGVLFPGLGSDALLPAFDETFYPLLPLWAWTTAASAASERSGRFAAVEAGLDLVLLAGLFWSQGGFRVSLYPHPSLLAAAAAGMLFLTLVILALLDARGRGRTAGFLIRLGGLFAILLLALLLILDRYAEDASARGGGLLKPTFFRFDLARYLKLESEISLSDELVLIVRKDSADTNVLLRRFTLSEYDRRGIFRPDAADDSVPETLPRGRQDWLVPAWEGRAALDQEYWILTLDRSALLAVDAPVSVAPYRLEAGSSFSSAYALVSRAAAPSLPLLLETFDPELTPPGFALSAADRSRYTKWGDDPRIGDLARTVSEEAGSYYERVNAVLTFLRESYYYSLKPGVSADGNQLTHFLFEGKKGYCSYFAFSMTLLLRSLGIPSRVAAGFFVDPDTAVLDFHPVRANMAHAWTEVWFGEYGWVSFDPTSRVPAPGERFEEARGLDPAALESLLKEILGAIPKTSGEPEPGLDEPAVLARLRTAAAWAARRVWLLLPAFYLAMIAAARALRTVRVRRIRDGRRKALAGWDGLETALAALGTRRGRGETVPDFADRLEGKLPELAEAGFGALARLWERVLFAPEAAPQELRALEEGLASLKALARRRTTAFRRAAAFLDIRTALRPLPGSRRR